MKAKIKQSFSKSAATYDSVASMHEQIIDELLASLAGPHHNILDIGCGTGTLALKLAKKFPKAEIVGLDLAPGMVETAQAKCPQIKFMLGDGEDLGFPGHSFDLVVSTSSLQWMDQAKVFKEVRRVLKPGGEFCFTTFGPATMAEVKAAGLAINSFLSKDELIAGLAPYFQIKEFNSQLLEREFAGFFALGKYLKTIGAAVPAAKKQRGLRKIKTGKIKDGFEVFSVSAFVPNHFKLRQKFYLANLIRLLSLMMGKVLTELSGKRSCNQGLPPREKGMVLEPM